MYICMHICIYLYTHLYISEKMKTDVQHVVVLCFSGDVNGSHHKVLSV